MVAGKLALVTGAGSGIGREVCRILAREGAKVIATDRNTQTVQKTVAALDGSKHLSLNLEVTDQHSVKDAFKNAIKEYSKPPGIIVNCAGITRDQFISKLTENEFEQVINVNLKGTFLVMQTAVKEMLDAKMSNGSSIINVGSIIGKQGNIGQGNYAASKAGVEALTKTAASEFGQFGIRVNAVLPGLIRTPMTETIPDNVEKMFLKQISLKRMGEPEEVAEVIAFLASSKSSYVSGASIEITGGMR